MNDDQYLLANAYLDGELDAAERVRAEADPEVVAEVARLRVLRDELRRAEPPSVSAREAAIAAALGAFDSVHATPAPAAPPAGSNVTPIRRRPRSATWLTAAAAVLVIGLLGVVAAQVDIGGDDEDDGGMDAAMEAAPAATDSPPSRIAPSEDAIAESAPAADMATTEDSAAATEASATEAPAATAMSAATEAPAESAEATMSSVMMIPDEAALGEAGADLLAREQDGTLGATPETRCTVVHEDGTRAEVLGQAVFGTGAAARDVLLAVDRTTGDTYALDPGSCTIVATTATP